jgi:NADPH:quinone reductase-like Zn-dependent oxidoreductase
MRAVTLDGFEAPPGLREDLPEPQPASRELLVRVHASSLNPVDTAVSSGMLRGMLEYEFPVIMGRDYAGVVEAVGSSATCYRPGDEVYGFVPLASPTLHDGGWADYLVIPQETSVARKPAGVDFATAGAAPLAALTAIAALDALALHADDTVLVVGASGGVGSLFVQLAASAGANVVTSGLSEDDYYLRALGASEVVDRDDDLAAHIRATYPDGVDALLDVVSQMPDASLLGPAGRLASPIGAAGEGSGRFNVSGEATTPNLERLAELLESGRLRVPIERTYPLEHAPAALDEMASTHVQGKRAISIA